MWGLVLRSSTSTQVQADTVALNPRTQVAEPERLPKTSWIARLAISVSSELNHVTLPQYITHKATEEENQCQLLVYTHKHTFPYKMTACMYTDNTYQKNHQPPHRQ